MSALIKSLGLQHAKVVACDDNAHFDGTRTPGEWTARANHRKAWADFVASGRRDDQFCMFIEDDAVVAGHLHPEGAVHAIQLAFDELPADADVLYLGRCYDHCHEHEYVGAHVVKVTDVLCLHAYAATRRACRFMLGLEGIPVDNVIRDAIVRGDIKAYASADPVFYQDRWRFGSVIGQTRGNGGTEEIPTCKPHKQGRARR